MQENIRYTYVRVRFLFLRRAMLPGYRQAPDYETAIQQKYHNHYPNNNNRTAVVSNSAVLYSSHPDIHSATHLQQVRILMGDGIQNKKQKISQSKHFCFYGSGKEYFGEVVVGGGALPKVTIFFYHSCRKIMYAVD